jgi:hypothetical protein
MRRYPKVSAGVAMQDSRRALGRFRLFSLSLLAVTGVVVLSPPANADEPFDPSPPPPIVTGGTVDTPATIVVVPQQTPAVAAGPIDPKKPIGVDPNVLPAKPTCCYADANGVLIPNWLPKANPPVAEKDRRKIDSLRTIFLDNHSRYWLIKLSQPMSFTPNSFISLHKGITFEQVGGWEAPSSEQAPPTELPPDQNGLAPDQSGLYRQP